MPHSEEGWDRILVACAARLLAGHDHKDVNLCLPVFRRRFLRWNTLCSPVHRATAATLSAHVLDCNQFFATPQMYNFSWVRLFVTVILPLNRCHAATAMQTIAFRTNADPSENGRHASFSGIGLPVPRQRRSSAR